MAEPMTWASLWARAALPLFRLRTTGTPMATDTTATMATAIRTSKSEKPALRTLCIVCPF